MPSMKEYKERFLKRNKRYMVRVTYRIIGAERVYYLQGESFTLVKKEWGKVWDNMVEPVQYGDQFCRHVQSLRILEFTKVEVIELE